LIFRLRAAASVRSPNPSGAELASEPLPCCLPGYAEGQGNPVPGLPAGTRGRYPLGKDCLVTPGRLRSLGDRRQFLGALQHGGLGVKLVSTLLEPAGGFLIGIAVGDLRPLAGKAK